MTRKLPAAIGIVAALWLAACAGTPPSHYYLLSATPEASAASTPAVAGPLLFVDPVTVAPYADRAQMVTRSADSQVHFAEFEVWAQPVGSLITAALVDDLAKRFGPDRVLATPSRLDFAADYRLSVDVLQFDVDEAGNAVLDARWTLLGGPDEHFLKTGRERLAEQIGDPGSYPQRVAALSRAIATLAGQVGQTIAATRIASR